MSGASRNSARAAPARSSTLTPGPAASGVGSPSPELIAFAASTVRVPALTAVPTSPPTSAAQALIALRTPANARCASSNSVSVRLLTIAPSAGTPRTADSTASSAAVNISRPDDLGEREAQFSESDSGLTPLSLALKRIPFRLLHNRKSIPCMLWHDRNCIPGG